MADNNKLPMTEIVMKLIGPVEPIGSTNIDAQRYENLEVMLELIDKMLFEVDQIAMHNAKREEHSMRFAGRRCARFLTDCGIEEDQ